MILFASNAQNATTHPHSSSVRNSGKNFTSERLRNVQNDNTQSTSPTCSCGVFLSGQFVKGSPKPPEGNPAIVNELEDQFTCGTVGVKQCANKCLEGVSDFLYIVILSIFNIKRTFDLWNNELVYLGNEKRNS